MYLSDYEINVVQLFKRNLLYDLKLCALYVQFEKVNSSVFPDYLP